MKNYTLLLLTVCLPTLLFAQSHDTAYVRWKISTKPTELILGNIPLTIERVFKARTIGLTLAFRPAYQDGGEVSSIGTGMAGGYQYQYAVNKVVQGVYAGINTKNYIFGYDENFYIDPELFYRRWWCDGKKESYDNVEGYNFKATRTETVNVYGLKMLAGYSFVLFKTKPVKIIADLYGGIGVRYKTWDYESQNGLVQNVYYTSKSDKGQAFLPSVHAGIQLGLGF